jgi:hypothetical protein
MFVKSAVFCGIVATAVGALSAAASGPDVSALVPRAPVSFDARPAAFSDAQKVWVLPMIRTLACARAELAVRYALRPHRVGFQPCIGVDTSAIHVDMTDDTTDVSVSGFADMDGVAVPFSAALQHNPVSVSDDGFNLVRLDVRP